MWVSSFNAEFESDEKRTKKFTQKSYRPKTFVTK